MASIGLLGGGQSPQRHFFGVSRAGRNGFAVWRAGAGRACHGFAGKRPQQFWGVRGFAGGFAVSRLMGGRSPPQYFLREDVRLFGNLKKLFGLEELV